MDARRDRARKALPESLTRTLTAPSTIAQRAASLPPFYDHADQLEPIWNNFANRYYRRADYEPLGMTLDEYRQLQFVLTIFDNFLGDKPSKTP